LPPT
jgi:hypothetical protein